MKFCIFFKGLNVLSSISWRNFGFNVLSSISWRNFANILAKFCQFLNEISKQHIINSYRHFDNFLIKFCVFFKGFNVVSSISLGNFANFLTKFLRKFWLFSKPNIVFNKILSISNTSSQYFSQFLTIISQIIHDFSPIFSRFLLNYFTTFFRIH